MRVIGGAPEAPALENIANKVSPPLTCEFTARDRRFDLRRGLWHVSSLPRVRGCGRAMRASEVGVVWSEERGAGFSGLVTCGSVWVCPVCAAKVLGRRSVEVGAGLLAWQQSGGTMALVTLTMRHHRGHGLGQELDALATAWRTVITSSVWRKWRRRLGSPGLVKVVEITHGANGWHAHLHFVLLLDGSVSGGDVASLRDWLFPKWHRAVLATGMPGALAVGQDARIVDGATAAATLAEYVTKSADTSSASDIGRELMGAWSKTARSDHGTSPAWHLLADFLVTGDADSLDLWHQYERATKGRRQVSWTVGLRDLLGVGQESTDEEIADESAGDDAVVFITRDGWATVLGLSDPSSRLLAALDDGGASGLRQYLDTHGIDYREAR